MTYRPVSWMSSSDEQLCREKRCLPPSLFMLPFLGDFFWHYSLYGSLLKRKKSIEIYKIIKKTNKKEQDWHSYPVILLDESLLFTDQGYKSHNPPPGCQKRATTFMSRLPAPPEPAPEPWAWFGPWPTWRWWRPELKLAHSRLVESLGDRETSGPAPSRDNVAKQTERKAEGELEQSYCKNNEHPNCVSICSRVCVCICLHQKVGVTCCVLIPDFDRAIMGGCYYPCCATRGRRQKHTAGCGLQVSSVLHNFTARLTQVPELTTQTQLHWDHDSVRCVKTICTIQAQ